MKLTCEVIPKSSFFTNVRSEVSTQEWDRLRKDCYRKANYRCEICGGKGEKWPVECHEVWDYDEKTEIQKLIRLISLCPLCHQVKHIGLSKMRGLVNETMNHLMRVNKITKEEAIKHVEEVFEVWCFRNSIEWILDLSHLETL